METIINGLKQIKNRVDSGTITTVNGTETLLSKQLEELLKVAINYTHCCKSDSELLKSKERLDYKSWKKAMGYKRIEKPVLKKGNDYVELEKVMLEFDEYERTF